MRGTGDGRRPAQGAPQHHRASVLLFIPSRRDRPTPPRPSPLTLLPRAGGRSGARIKSFCGRRRESASPATPGPTTRTLAFRCGRWCGRWCGRAPLVSVALFQRRLLTLVPHSSDILLRRARQEAQAGRRLRGQGQPQRRGGGLCQKVSRGVLGLSATPPPLPRPLGNPHPLLPGPRAPDSRAGRTASCGRPTPTKGR